MSELKLSQIRSIEHEDLWAQQILFWRSHLDIFIEDYFGVKLKDVQKIHARQFGNCDSLTAVESRGFGKTWLTALCCLAVGVLYPNSPIIVSSSTMEQASLVLKKIEREFSTNENIMREIKLYPSMMRKIDNTWIISLKNGSYISARSLFSLRGSRAKVIVIDEAPEVAVGAIDAIASPIRNYKRSHMTQMELPDYESKIIQITSACLKSNGFYTRFVDILRAMSNGDRREFAFALDYRAAARAGLTDMAFFEKERRRMPESLFAMEYGSIFVGSEAGSIFPYELSERCRTLWDVETAMPARSTSDYIISVDIATSRASHADNAVISVIKLVELEDGGYLKKLVLMRSYHGKRLDYLSTEVRKILVKFPRVTKVVFDGRGLGDGFPRFFAQPWIDPETNKEYPPLVLDTEATSVFGAVPLLHSFSATVAKNQQMVTALCVAMEQRSIEFPVGSRHVSDGQMNLEDGDEARRSYTIQEKAVFIEADALQIEMGNIVGKYGVGGSVIYDVAKSTQHKDRYSSIAMGVWYIANLEDIRRRRVIAKQGSPCIGLVYTI